MAKTQPASYRNNEYDIFVKATDASTRLDYDGVCKACDNILNVSTDEMARVAGNIEKVQLGKETLCVKDKSLQPLVDEVGALIKSLPEQGIAPSLESIKEMSLEIFNNIQTELNDKAKADFDAKVRAAAAAASAK